MRRPLVGFCFAEAFGILLAHYGLIRFQHLCMICAGVFFVIRGRGKKQWILCMTVLLLLGFARTEMQSRTPVYLPGCEDRVVRLSGVVTKVEAKEYYLALTLAADQGGLVDEVPVEIREKVLIRLDLKPGEYAVAFPYGLAGRRVICTGRISCPESVRNPGGFDYRLYLRGKGIHTLCNVSRYRFQVLDAEKPLLHGLSLRKGAFLNAADEQMSPEGFSLLAGLLFGEKSYIREDVYEGFRNNGMGHIFAVSGLHVGLLYGVLLKLTRGRRRDISLLLMLTVILTYAALANFSISVLRASAMAVTAMLASPLRRRYDLTSAASAAALVLMTARPLQLFDSGFQLSFVAAYSLGVAMPFVQLKIKELADRRRKAWISSVGSVLGPCAVVQVAMAPLLAYHFLLFAPVGFLINPPALLLAGLLLPVGLLMFLLSLASGVACWFGTMGVFLSEVMFSALAGMAEGLASVLLRLSALARAIPGGGMCPAPPLGLLLLFYVIFFLYFSEIGFILMRRGKRKVFALLATFCLTSAVVLPFACGLTASLIPWRYHTPLVTFLDVGQGDCIHIRDGKINILVDGGGSFYSNVGTKILEPYLLKNGITGIDLAFITHADLDHRKGIQELSQRMAIDTLVLSDPYKGDPEAFDDILRRDTVYVSQGDFLAVGSRLSFRILSPEKQVPEGLNDNGLSLVMMLNHSGLDILLTGDLEKAGESNLKNIPTCDILKVAHHGSAGSTSPDFLNAASPAYAAISCGKNNIHGHPAPAVIELLEKSGIIFGRTDQWGALCLRSISPDRFLIENAAREVCWDIKRKDPE